MRRLICAGLLLSCGLVLAGCGSSSPPVTANPAPVAPGPAPVVAPVIAPPTAAAVATVTPAQRAAMIAPLLDDMTVGILCIDPSRFDPDQFQADNDRRLQAAGKTPDKEFGDLFLKTAKLWKESVSQVYCVVSLNDVPLRGPYLAFKLLPNVDQKKVFLLYKGGDLNAPIDQKEFDSSTLTKGDLFVMGDPATILRLKSLTPTTVPNLEAGFQLAGDSMAQFVLAPTDSARAQLTRMVGDLPPQLNLNGADLIAAIKLGAFTYDAPPNLQIKLDVQAQDASGAQRLQQALQSSLENVKRLSPAQETLDVIQALTPQVNADRLSIALKQGDATIDKFYNASVLSMHQQREVAEQMQNSHHLKEIALGMLNSAATTGLLPQAKSQKDGQPLLSWRVHLLPMLGEQALYSQFKLDEPWDSATNMPLVKRMPRVYAKSSANQAAGTTTYLVPVGEKTAFTGNEAISIAQISDGTSNTLLVVDVSPDRAVIWTKPDDWQVDINNPFTGLPAKPFQGALCDGSVRTFNPTSDAAQFARVITRNDGLPVDWALVAVNSPVNANPFSFTPGGAVPPGGIEPGRERPGNLQPGVVDPTTTTPGAVGPDGRPLTPGESVFITQAKQAFTEGRDRDGFNYLYAEAIAGQDKDGLRGTIRWVDALKRPAMAIRWGVGIQYTAPRNYSGGPSTIGKIIQGAQANPGSGNGVDPAAPQPGAPPATVLDYYTSELGTKLLDGLRTRSEQGQFGDVLKLIAGTPGVNNPNSGNQVLDRNGKQVAPKVQTIAPGIVFVGIGKDKDLLAKAKEEELDALVIFAVGVQPQRTLVVNTTKWIAYDVAKGTEITESKAIKATVVDAARKENKGVDPVADAMEKFFAAIDGTYKMGELPATATPDKVAVFAGKLADSNPVNKLPVLLAILFFQDKASLPAAEVKTAYEKLLGPELGVQLLGDVPQRQKAIVTLLPKPPAGPETPGGLGTGKRLGLGQ